MIGGVTWQASIVGACSGFELIRLVPLRHHRDDFPPHVPSMPSWLRLRVWSTVMTVFDWFFALLFVGGVSFCLNNMYAYTYRANGPPLIYNPMLIFSTVDSISWSLPHSSVFRTLPSSSTRILPLIFHRPGSCRFGLEPTFMPAKLAQTGATWRWGAVPLASAFPILCSVENPFSSDWRGNSTCRTEIN